METKANFAMIGAATLAGIVAAMLFALWIAGASLNRQYHVYVVQFEGPVRGLARGGEVRFQGIKVGEVTDLRIDPDDATQVLARVRIDAATPVRANSIGRLEPVGLTGVNLIQIEAGTTASPLLEPRLGQAPPRIHGEPSEIDKLLGAGGDIAERTSRALLAIQSLLTEENVKRVSNTLGNLEKTSAELERNKRLFADARATIENLSAMSGKARERDIVGKADDAVAAMRDAAQRSDAAIASIQLAAEIASEQNLPELSIAVQDMRRLSVALETVALSLERNPNQFVVGAQRPTVKVNP